ncbi:MAG TPA: phosphoribosylformylglycinamidine synthase subunit PurL [Firmicutes bacterium]|nr:phosphoribosylformylglycinamidine synthase subunit PurL [Bacillota bacterium]
MRKEPSPQDIAAEKIYRDLGLTDSEYDLVKQLLGRLPNYTETGLFSVMWSEHCSYKNSKQLLRCFPTQGEHVLMGPGEGAGIIDIGDGLGIAFKIESHNHPSAIEPFQGAATGVGGILRDVYSMGAQPLALLNSLRFGDPKIERVKYLVANAVAGIAAYGNQTGVPTVGGEVYFDHCYTHNPLINAMCVGVVHHDQICRGTAEGEGNSVLYVGRSTGRDGIEGATFASAELSDNDEPTHAVAIGDPKAGKALMEACLEMVQLPSLIGIQDMGAAGLVSSSAEMANKGGHGIELNLDLVPQREAGMTPYEMMLSESQERMLLVVEKGSEHEYETICEKYGLACVTVGRVTTDGQLRLFHEGQIAAEVPVDALTAKAPVYNRTAQVAHVFGLNQALEVTDLPIADPEKTLKQLLSMPSLASKEWIYKQFDFLAMGNTVAGPGMDAGVVQIPGTKKAVALTTDCNSIYIELDPRQGSAIAVCEAARNLVCTGAKPLAISDNLNFGSPLNPEVFWQLEQSIEGISMAARKLNCPVVSGNVSLFNETNGQPIYPTPIIAMVGLIEDVDRVITGKYQNSGDLIVLIGRNWPELGGSHLQKLIWQNPSGRIPTLDLEYELRAQQLVYLAIQAGLLISAHDVAEGGLAVAVLESAFGTGMGVEVNFTDGLSVSAALFGESQSRFIVSINPGQLPALQQCAQELNVDLRVIGKVIEDDKYQIVYNDQELINCPRSELELVWKEGLSCLMR